MQATSRHLEPVPAGIPATARAGLRQHFQTRLVIALTGDLSQDRDRWVSVVCAAGFALLTGIDWLAA